MEPAGLFLGGLKWLLLFTVVCYWLHTKPYTLPGRELYYSRVLPLLIFTSTYLLISASYAPHPLTVSAGGYQTRGTRWIIEQKESISWVAGSLSCLICFQHRRISFSSFSASLTSKVSSASACSPLRSSVTNSGALWLLHGAAAYCMNECYCVIRTPGKEQARSVDFNGYTTI